MKRALIKSGVITGLHDDISGNLTGISGNLTGVRGDLDRCEITNEEREEGVDIEDLLLWEAK
jgi:hypothetical protein